MLTPTRELKKLVLIFGALAAIFSSACNLATPLALFVETKKRVPPEFDKLPGTKVAVLVWAQPSTYFDYPHVRFELATYIGDKLNAEMAQKNQPVAMIDPRDVEDFVQKTAGADIDPYKVGRQFGADYVIYVELTEFQVRDPEQPQLLRGRIGGSISVHDAKNAAATLRRFELTPVQSIYPEDQPLVINATNTPLVREATYRKFAEQVARKFYEHTLDLS